MTKYIITKIEEKKVGQITLPNGIGLYMKENMFNYYIEVVFNCHLNPAYLNEENIFHNICVVLDKYNATKFKDINSISLDKKLRIESKPCENNLNTTWTFYDVEETSKEIDPSQTISIGLIENVIL